MFEDDIDCSSSIIVGAKGLVWLGLSFVWLWGRATWEVISTGWGVMVGSRGAWISCLFSEKG